MRGRHARRWPVEPVPREAQRDGQDLDYRKAIELRPRRHDRYEERERDARRRGGVPTPNTLWNLRTCLSVCIVVRVH